MVDLEAVRERLVAFLQERHGAPVEVGDLEILTGGYSLVTVAFSATTADGSARYVLRTNPPGDAALTQSDRAQEAEILAALTDAGTVPMPRLRWADPMGDALGSPSLILDFVDGPQVLSRLREVDEPELARIALQLAETIGTVHVAGNAAAPANLERPLSWDAYIDGFIEGWRAVERAYPERNPFIRWLADWLDGHRPPPAPLTLVHGEFQTGNVMIDSTGAMQVIDWEYAHIGDPRADLGWLQQCAAFAPPDPIAVDPVAFCRRYCEVTGLAEDVINPLTVAWFSVAAGYKSIGALLGGIAGLATGDNHLITSAYLVSAMPFLHRLWRDTVRELEAAASGMPEALEEVVS
jgi:aminoglycoside phosphotransferase (APT) family kinase protein